MGLPYEYAQRGHGFAGMRTDTEAMGGRLIVETLGRRGGTTVTCTVPYEQAAEGDMISSDKPIRVMLVDDHPIVRMGLRGILEPSRDFEVVGEVSDGVEAVETSERLEPDVIVMDVMMPRQDGVEACREIMEKLPDTQVLMLTASTEEDAVAAGATGYLQKYSGGKELEEAVRAIAEGRLRIPDKTLRRTLAMIRGELWEKTRRGSSALTARERELLTLFAGGEPYARIAEAKGIRPVTVRNTISRVQEKLGLGTKQELVIWAVRNGLVDDLELGQ